MKKELPVIKINSKDYLVDVDYGLFREKSDPERVIHRGDLKDVGIHYLLITPEQTGVAIPYMVELDPVGISKKYGIPIKDLPVTDGALKCNREWLGDRLQGKLPTIELARHTFFVDLRLGLLRPKDDFSTMGIELERLPLNESGTGFQFLYNPKTHTEVIYDENWREIPKGVMAIEIPGELTLDPVGSLMKYSDVLDGKYPFGNRDEAFSLCEKSVGFRELVDRYPVRYNLKARVIPWERTIIPEQIARNKQKIKEPALRQKPKKGKGRKL
jgi:hypothetical protein